MTEATRKEMLKFLRNREDELRRELNRHLSTTPHQVSIGHGPDQYPCRVCSESDSYIGEVMLLQERVKTQPTPALKKSLPKTRSNDPLDMVTLEEPVDAAAMDPMELAVREYARAKDLKLEVRKPTVTATRMRQVLIPGIFATNLLPKSQVWQAAELCIRALEDKPL